LYDETMLHRLPDGTRVRLRPIRPEDKGLLADGLRRLSPESIHRRFLGFKPHFTSAELRYLTEVDGRDHIALVAVDDADPGCLIAVARCVRIAERADTGDIGIVVGDRWQGLGLGRLMLGALAARAAEQGIVRFSAVLLADNQPARHLLRAVSARFEERGIVDGVREVAGDFAQA
jgi:RimJ/RimL family protein N-acetyltransferase